MSHCNTRSLGTIRVLRNPLVPLDTIRNTRMPSIRLKLRIVHNENRIDALALLDSGAEGIYCNSKFVTKHQLPKHKLQHPIFPKNVDGTLNKAGAIHHFANLRMEMGTKHRETTELLITDTGDHDILLGTNWLKTHNPSINWSKNLLKLDRCPTSCWMDDPREPRIAHLLPTMDWEAQEDDLLELVNDDMDTIQLITNKWDQITPLLARTTVSTTLAKQLQKQVMAIPKEFSAYTKVFSDEEAQQLPKHQPWDHKIDLLPGKVM